MPLRRLLLPVLLVLALPASASAAATSDNWAGYAVHRAHVRLKSVNATWAVPTVTCDGSRSFSAAWVGLGGFHTNAAALEQAGTESDCSRSGQPRYSAWYELVPGASQTLQMTVKPGDAMSVRVSVSGRRATFQLSDLTRSTRVTRRITASAVDTSSVEWIVEAPSECVGARCGVLPLASFADTTFANAHAVSASGHGGTISDSSWSPTAIDLASDGPRFGGRGPETGAGGSATTGALSADGASFSVTVG